jgi:hypothetical protein
MTIGIGVVCCESPDKRPSHIILASDSLGSFGDSFSTTAHHKMMADFDVQVYAVGADDMEHSADLMQKIILAVSKLKERTFGTINEAIAYAAWDHRSARFKYDVLPEYGIAPTSHWKKDAREAGILDKLNKVFKKFRTHCCLIVSTFDSRGLGAQFLVNPDGSVQSCMLPGFTAIGSGADNALFWLAYRKQNIAMGLMQSAYHVYEAKLMAEQSPHVGKDDIELLITCADGDGWFLNSNNPTCKGCPLSIPGLKEMWNKFGPRATGEIK